MMQDNIPTLTDVLEEGAPEKEGLFQQPAEDEEQLSFALHSDYDDNSTERDTRFTDNDANHDAQLSQTLTMAVDAALEAALPEIKAQLQKELLKQLKNS